MDGSKNLLEKSEGSDLESRDVESQDVESRDVESQDVESQDVESRDIEDYSDLEDGLEQLKKEESQSSSNDIELKDYKEVCCYVKLDLFAELITFSHLFY